MTKFTPGEWYMNQLTPHKQIKESICIASNDGPITFMSTVSTNYIDTLWANARLIAAAPELYEACKEALESRDMQISWSALKKIQQALVKADGIEGNKK